ncbi:MAG: response regulator transcription factor [Pseudomonadota bacterium]
MTEKPMRIVLADELTLVRSGIRRLLESMTEPRVQVLGETGDGQALLEMASRFRPDLAIIEHALTSMGGQEVGQQMRRHYPDVKLMFLTARSEPNPVRLAMQSGAVAYVVKDAEPVELELALKAIAKGQSYLSPKVSAAAFDRRTSARDERQGVLSPRQRQVLRLMARGKSTKEIAALMGVSVKTVETHRARMAAILGLYGINPLMRFAIKMGMDNGEL